MDDNGKEKRTDTESMTKSASSEVFDSWTLVTDVPEPKREPSVAFEPLTPEKTDGDDDEKEHLDRLDVPGKRFADNHDHSNDDLSDGISIISESESAGRCSPHPLLKENLSSSNFKFFSNDFELPNNGTEDNVYPESTSPPAPVPATRTRESFSQTRKNENELTNVWDEFAPVPTTTLERISPMVRGGLNALFYLGACLAILGFIGKLQYPGGSPLADDNEFSSLSQRVENLELQNNFLLAEIDFLNKQVKYLTDKADGNQGKSFNKNGKNGAENRGKETKNNGGEKTDNFFGGVRAEKAEPTVKVWTGIGDDIKPVNIPKKEMKAPYKCEANQEDIGGFCVDIDAVKEELIGNGNAGSFLQDEIEKLRKIAGEAINEGLKFNSEKEPEKVEEPVKESGENWKKVEERIENKKDQFEQKERFEKPEKRFEGSRDHKNSKERVDTKPVFIYRQRKPNEKVDKRFDNSGERDHKNSKESKNGYKRDFKKRDDDSGERFERKSFDKKFNDKYKKQDKRDADGDWHERLMRDREDSRRDNEKHQRGNWYVERGNAREEARLFDKPSRHKDSRER